MHNTAALATLAGHHDRILAHLATVMPLLDAATCPDIADLAARRWRMARMLREYQIFKHRVVFDPVLATRDRELREQAETMKAQCIAMGEAFGDYLRLCCDGGATTHWSKHRVAALTMIARLRAHLSRESRAAAALLAHPGYEQR